MKMKGCIVLCFISLMAVSMADPIKGRMQEIRNKLGNELFRKSRACKSKGGNDFCSKETCTAWDYKKHDQAYCEKLGCDYGFNYGGIPADCTKLINRDKGCFPGSAMVTTPTGNVAMETLNIGDSVLTVLDKEEMGFTNVVSFAERKPDMKAHFLSITTVNQAGHTQIVKLTATHNIYVKSIFADDYDEYKPRFAEDVFIGDMLATLSNNGTSWNEAIVTDVALHEDMGLYNPLTETGTMLVDGTLVSCYVSFNDNLSHLAGTPIRWFPWLFVDEEKPLDGTLPYVETMKYIARNFIAPIVSVN